MADRPVLPASSPQPYLPLQGLVVLDVSTFIAAPAAAVVLGDFGADVIKVEALDGDPNRQSIDIASYPDSAVNYPWALDSRDKRSLAIDLKHAQGRAAFDRLLAKADIMVINFPPPVRRRLKLAWPDVKTVNPRLIYASLTGYGESGPDVDRPGFDATAYFARTGILDAARYEGQPPAFSLPAQGDRATAMSMVSGILLGLLHRQRTGTGAEITTSLLANGVWAAGITAQAALVGAFHAPRPPRDRPRSALANPYKAGDGRWFSLVLVREDAMWPDLCRALERPELLEDARFGTQAERRKNAAALVAILDGIFAAKPWPQWRAILTAHGLVFGEIQTMHDLPNDQQMAATGVVVASADAQLGRTIASPIWTDFAAKRTPGLAPSLGQHSDEILRFAGLNEQEIAALRVGGAIR